MIYDTFFIKILLIAIIVSPLTLIQAYGVVALIIAIDRWMFDIRRGRIGYFFHQEGFDDTWPVNSVQV